MTISNDQDDRELQNQVESGLSAAGSITSHYLEDAEAYRALFALLNDKPAVGLPADFPSKVVAGIQATQDQLVDVKWNFLLPLCVVVVLGILYGASLWFNIGFSSEMPRLLSQYKSPMAFGLVCFLAIQYMDHLLIKKRRLHG